MENNVDFDVLLQLKSLNVYVCILIGIFLWYIFQSSASGR